MNAKWIMIEYLKQLKKVDDNMIRPPIIVPPKISNEQCENSSSDGYIKEFIPIEVEREMRKKHIEEENKRVEKMKKERKEKEKRENIELIIGCIVYIIVCLILNCFIN